MLTLHQLKMRGITLANKCFLCEEEKETIDHLLIPSRKTRSLWDLFLAIVGSSWVFPLLVRQTLLAWQGTNVGRKHEKIRMAAPLPFLDCLAGKEQGGLQGRSPAHKMKFSFFSTLWSWANLYSVDNIDSLVDFLSW